MEEVCSFNAKILTFKQVDILEVGRCQRSCIYLTESRWSFKPGIEFKTLKKTLCDIGGDQSEWMLSLSLHPLLCQVLILQLCSIWMLWMRGLLGWTEYLGKWREGCDKSSRQNNLRFPQRICQYWCIQVKYQSGDRSRSI